MNSTALPVILAGLMLAAGDDPKANDVVILDDYAPCGIVSLYLVTQIRQVPADWEQVKELVGPPGPGRTHSFADLSRAATQLGMHPVGLQVRRDALKDLPLPAIVQVRDPDHPDEPPHLLVFLRSEADGVSLLDAPYPPYFLPESQFASVWTGNVLVFARDAEEARQLRNTAQASPFLGLAFWVWIAGGGLLLGLLMWRSTWLRGAGTAMLRSSGRVTPTRRQALVGAALLAVSAGLVALSLHWSRGPVPAAPPRCVFEKPVLDLGELTPGGTTAHVTITNGGDRPLHISAVRSTCACAAVKAPEVIEPRQAGVLEVALSVAPGPGKARLTVESNDPEGPKTVVLAWRGTARARLSPGWIAATSAPADRPYERTVRLIYPGGKSAVAPRLERCACDSPRVEVREGKNDPMAIRYGVAGQLVGVSGELELHLTVQPPLTPERFETRCKLFLDYETAQTTLELPVTIDFAGGEFTPDVRAVVFSAASAGELVGQERLVRVAGRGPGMEVEVHALPSWLNGEVVSKTEKDCLVRLRVAAPPPEPLVQHTLHLGRASDPRSRVPLQVSAVALRR